MAKNGKPYRGRQGGYPRHYNNNNNNNNNNDNKPSGVPKSISDISPFIIQASSGTSFMIRVIRWPPSLEASHIPNPPVHQGSYAPLLILSLLPPCRTEATFVPIKDEDGSPTKFDKDTADLAYDTAVDDYKADHKDARKRANEWKETKSKVFESVRGLCSESVWRR